MKVGLIGLEFAGKKTLFNLLTGKKSDTHSINKEEVATVNVPDERIEFLEKFYNSKKKIYSQIEFHLLPSIKKESKETQKALTEAKEVDMFGIVLRAFHDDNVFHPYNRIDPVLDYEIIKNELIFADLFLIETRLERLEKQMRAKKEEYLLKEKEILLKFKEQLENNEFLNKVDLREDELKIVRGFQFLTLKPIFTIINCDDTDLNKEFNIDKDIKGINISIKIESEIAELDEEERKIFLEDLGIKESSLNRLIRFTYDYGNLISFFTAGEKEIHSWQIKKGTTAVKAAGVIHSDFEKGFIRAEVISFEDLKKAGSEAAAKKEGLYRLEGKDYIVQDGDIIIFRFNI